MLAGLQAGQSGVDCSQVLIAARSVLSASASCKPARSEPASPRSEASESAPNMLPVKWELNSSMKRRALAAAAASAGSRGGSGYRLFR